MDIERAELYSFHDRTKLDLLWQLIRDGMMEEEYYLEVDEWN